jgi:pyruvate/2-oxoglutarate dehydrogenase complex dihydrolipoamide acyltransferase (E2) component
MPVTVRLPQLGKGVYEAKVLTCTKEAGAAVRRDEPIAEIETDKATFSIESPADGVLGPWQVQPG